MEFAHRNISSEIPISEHLLNHTGLFKQSVSPTLTIMGTWPAILVMLPSGCPLSIHFTDRESLARYVDTRCRHSAGNIWTDVAWTLVSGTVGYPMVASWQGGGVTRNERLCLEGNWNRIWTTAQSPPNFKGCNLAHGGKFTSQGVDLTYRGYQSSSQGVKSSIQGTQSYLNVEGDSSILGVQHLVCWKVLWGEIIKDYVAYNIKHCLLTTPTPRPTHIVL